MHLRFLCTYPLRHHAWQWAERWEGNTDVSSLFSALGIGFWKQSKVDSSEWRTEMFRELITAPLPRITHISAPLLSYCLLQSQGSLGCPLSPYILLSTALFLKKMNLCKPLLGQFQSLWSTVVRAEWRANPSSWLCFVQRQNLESLSSGRTIWSAESYCASGKR